MGSLDIRKGVADNEAVCGRGLRKISKCLLQQACFRLSTIALLFVVRTNVEGIDMCTMFCQMFLKLGMKRFNICTGIETECDAALVCKYNHAFSGAIQGSDCEFGARKRVKVVPLINVCALRGFVINHPIAI